MDYTIKRYLPDTPYCQVELSLLLAYRDWCVVKKSPQWEALEALVDLLQKKT